MKMNKYIKEMNKLVDKMQYEKLTLYCAEVISKMYDPALIAETVGRMLEIIGLVTEKRQFETAFTICEEIRKYVYADQIPQVLADRYYHIYRKTDQDCMKIQCISRLVRNENPVYKRILAMHFRNGSGIKASQAGAAFWLGKAAAQGLAIAQYELACMYRDGIGVTRSEQKAQYWFAFAEKNGFRKP